jgi:hypothetical protein
MTIVPGDYNWTQHADVLPDDPRGDRMLRHPLFLLGWEYATELDVELGEARRELKPLLTEADRRLVDEFESALGLEITLWEVEAGRGAGAESIAIQVAEAIALAGGVGAAVAGTARSVKAAYQRFGELKGHRPLVSLGAAEHLVAADLMTRLGSEDLQLIGSGDMQSQSPDRSFAAGDAFYVIFRAKGALHHYHVTAYGELHYIGTSPMLPNWWEDDPPPWPEEA